MARYDDLDTSAIAYATFLACIVLLLIILLVRGLCFFWVEGEVDRKLADSHYVSADEEISEQKTKIAVYSRVEVEVVDPAAKEGEKPKMEERIHIPVERAKEVLLKELVDAETPSS